MKLAICDDDPHICETIEKYIYETIKSPALPEVERFNSGTDLLKRLQDDVHFNIFYLDYEMQGINGLETALKIREDERYRDSLIIYISSHTNVIFSCLEADIFQFITKPINPDEFKRILLKAFERCSRLSDTLVISANRAEEYIPKHEILYIESIGRKIAIHTVKNEYTMYGKLDSIEQELSIAPFSFVRIHKSYIINLDYCTLVSHRKVTLKNGRQLEISRSYLEHFQELYLKYKGRRL